MSRRPTIHDVARAAGVSAATADRVLNARKAAEAAHAVGYHAALRSVGEGRAVRVAEVGR